jgi:hypothetical protein
MTGQLETTPDLIGIPAITASFSFVGYEITDQAAIKKFLEDA